jgi:hypothetical protein
MKARSATFRRVLVTASVACIAAVAPLAALASNSAGGGG